MTKKYVSPEEQRKNKEKARAENNKSATPRTSKHNKRKPKSEPALRVDREDRKITGARVYRTKSGNRLDVIKGGKDA